MAAAPGDNIVHTITIVGHEASGNKFVPHYMPIKHQVPPKIRQSIWAGEFVDMRCLLMTRDEEESYTLRFNGTGLTCVPLSKKDPLSIEAWNRYAALVAEQDSTLIVPLAQHMEKVLRLADKKRGWRYYDEQYRRLVADGTIKWGEAELELYNMAFLEEGSQTHAGPGSRSPRSPYHPNGVCFPYHTTGICSAGAHCSRQHQCYNCLRMHPVFQCREPLTRPFKVQDRYKPKPPTSTQGSGSGTTAPFQAAASSGKPAAAGSGRGTSK
jgi:hypothetical protein